MGNNAAKKDENNAAKSDDGTSQPEKVEPELNNENTTWYDVEREETVSINNVPERTDSGTFQFHQFHGVPPVTTAEQNLEDEMLARALSLSMMEFAVDQTSEEEEILAQMTEEAVILSQLETLEREVGETTAPSTSELSASSPGSKGVATVSSVIVNGDVIPRSETSTDESQPSEPGQPMKHIQLMDGLMNELRCPVCLLMFRRANTLGCGHTFCADCLQGSRALRGERCPMCRAEIESIVCSVVLDNVVESLAENESEA